MSDEITSALIGAGVAGLTLLIQSGLNPVLAKIFRSREQKRDILERYAPALGSSAEALYYRLTEIVSSGRHAYLHTESKPTSYHVYKFNSSVYRLARLIGWIWAIRTEQSLLAEVTDKKYSLHEVFSQFEFALANGDEVESWMVKELALLWGFSRPNEAAAGRLGAHLDSLVDNISPQHVARRSEICALSHDQKTKLLVEVASYFARELNEPAPQPIVVDNAAHEACRILSARQAWIYRDWQSAIGETIMDRAETGARAFDAKGYATFEHLYAKNDRWLNEVAAIFEDLDPSCVVPGDFRVAQVIAIRKATAKIILRLAEIDNIRSCVDAKLVKSIKAEFKD